MQLKSDKLKKLEAELADLERWLELGLVPKKDEPKHKEEIRVLQEKVDEEKGRLRFLKEHGDLEDYVAPKRQASKTVYQAEMPTLPDAEYGDGAVTEGFDENTSSKSTSTVGAEETTLSETKDEETTLSDEDDESYFSEKARWKRGGIIDPEANDW